MRITILSIKAEIKNMNTLSSDDNYVIAGWWVDYTVIMSDACHPAQSISARLFWKDAPEIESIMKKLKEVWKGMDK